MDIARIGFVGCGTHSTSNLYPMLKYARCSLEAVCDLDGELAARNARIFGGKQSFTDALTMMDNAQDLVMKIISTETNPELQRQAIHVLGIIDGSEHLAELYKELADRESRKAVLEAMSMADDSEGLLTVLQSEQDEELRTTAIHSLAIVGDERAAENLSTLYANGSSEEKSAVIESMLIMGDAEVLLGLLKQETDPEMKRKMLQILTLMDSEESDEYLFELLENKG